MRKHADRRYRFHQDGSLVSQNLQSLGVIGCNDSEHAMDSEQVEHLSTQEVACFLIRGTGSTPAASTNLLHLVSIIYNQSQSRGLLGGLSPFRAVWPTVLFF